MFRDTGKSFSGLNT